MKTLTYNGLSFYKKNGGLALYDCTVKTGNLVIPPEVDGLCVLYIEDGALRSSDVKSLIISDTLFHISKNAFYGCYFLKRLTISEIAGKTKLYSSLKAALFGKDVKISGGKNTFYSFLTAEQRLQVCLNYITGGACDFPEEDILYYTKKMRSRVFALAVKKDCVGAIIHLESFGKIRRETLENLITAAKSCGSTEALAHLLSYKQQNYGFFDIFEQYDKELTEDPCKKSRVQKLFFVKAGENDCLITGYKSDRKETFIPERMGSLPIVEVSPLAFSPSRRGAKKECCLNLTDIDLTSVRKLGNEAFSGCSSLKSVSLGEVQKIPDGCFSGCTSLFEIDLKNVVSVGQKAFYDCKSLKSAVFSKKLKELSPWAFYGCSSLENVVLPENLTEIPELCFARCSSIKKIDIPEGVKEIGKRAYLDCCGAEEIIFPPSVKKICWQAFSSLSSLKKLTIPGTVKVVGNLSFYYCTNITELILQEGIEALEWGAFSNLQKLKSVYLPKSLKSIDSYAFTDCYELREVHIPPEITDIKPELFQNCRFVRIYGKKDSFAKEYAWIYGIPFIEEKE